MLCAFFVSAWAGPAAGRAILVYGDSLSAAYGLARDRGWVTLLEERLKRDKIHYSVVNASISGETTQGGLSRIKKVLAQHRPQVTILALGANDGLRGLPVAEMRRNLAAMIVAAKAAKSRVLLVGVRMPPNYGPDYTQKFGAVFAALAKEHRIALAPFFFEGFAEERAYFQSDNLHPTEAAQPLLLENVWKALRPLLK